MALELVKCAHCGFKFKIDVKALEKDGETFVWRSFLNFWKPKPRRVKTIDLECPNCKKKFEHEVES